MSSFPEAELDDVEPPYRVLIKAFGEAKIVAEWSRDARCVVTYITLLSRIHHGWAPERAITQPVEPKHAWDRERGKLPPSLHTGFGETKSIYAWSFDPRCAVGYACLLHRLNRGVPLEKALLPDVLRANERMVEGFGERKSLSAWSRDARCKVTITCLRARLLRGTPLEEALEPRVLRKHANFSKVDLTAFGETKRISKWVKDPRCPFSREGVHYRMASGLSAEEALFGDRRNGQPRTL